MTELVPRPGFSGFRDDYGSVNYEGAVVLDIGADYGCTAEYFLERGAEHVIASEKRPDWLVRLREWADGKPVTVVGPSDASTLRSLLRTCKPDIVKMDCEGCESDLLGLPRDALTVPHTWIMETHGAYLHRAVVTLFWRSGYSVKNIWSVERPEPNRNRAVIKATRES